MQLTTTNLNFIPHVFHIPYFVPYILTSITLAYVLFIILFADQDSPSMDTRDDRLNTSLNAWDWEYLRRRGKDQDDLYVKLYLQAKSPVGLNIYSDIWPVRIRLNYNDRTRVLLAARRAQRFGILELSGYSIHNSKIVTFTSLTSPASSHDFIDFIRTNDTGINVR